MSRDKSPRRLGADTFLSRHSAQSFERARAIGEWSSSGSSCFVSSRTVRLFFPPVVPFYCCDGAMRFLKLNKRNGYPPRSAVTHGPIGDSWPMTFFGYPRGHRVKSETLVLEQHGGLTSPVDTRPRTKRLKNPTATAKDDPQDGTDSLSETLKLLVSNSWRRNLLLSSRRSG